MKQTRGGNNTNSLLFFVFGIFIFLVIFTEVSEAKRGCSAFGHACYGGHGKKRADINFPLQQASVEEIEPTFNGGSGEEMDPVILSSTTNQGTSSMDEDDLPNMNGYSPVVYQKFLRLSPLLRKWLQSYRRSQQEQHLLDQQQLQLENQL